MAELILKHTDLDREQLRELISLCNSAVRHLYDGHRIVIEEIIERFRGHIPATSQRKLSTIVDGLDDAIATSVKLRSALLADLKYYNEKEKARKKK